MSVEVRPFGVKCNIQCTYCYQNAQRAAGAPKVSYDFEKIKARVIATGAKSFSLFGGEPLVTPLKQLEEIFAWGFDTFGSNRMQTNGVLIGDNHIDLFKRYNVTVGVSLDGPGPLNDARWAGSLQRTRDATDKAEKAIHRLCDNSIETHMIITLHRLNASADRLPHLCNWVRYLDGVGVKSARLHVLEVDDPIVREKYMLDDAENIAAFAAFDRLEKELEVIKLDVFSDAERMLSGDDKNATCVWRGCDSYDTRAVQGIEADGAQTNCGRTNKEGIDFIKSDRPGYQRYIALYHTPQEHGGCAECRFFVACKGQCPGTAIDGDWRNRSQNCSLWMSMFERAEAKLLERGARPLSLDPRRPEIEAKLLGAWKEGQNPDLARVLSQLQPGLRA